MDCGMMACEKVAMEYGLWSECSADCGKGYVSRSAQCVRSAGNKTTLLEDSRCTGGRLPLMQLCSGTSCSTPFWTVGRQQACSALCGGGISSADITCNKPQQRGVDATETACKDLDRPDVERRCNTSPCETYTWKVSAWAACSAPCGGTRTRTMSCVFAPLLLPLAHASAARIYTCLLICYCNIACSKPARFPIVQAYEPELLFAVCMYVLHRRQAGSTEAAGAQCESNPKYKQTPGHVCLCMCVCEFMHAVCLVC
jgi:hypothetical protein